VRGSGPDRQWSEQPAAVEVRVLAPWWRDPRLQLLVGLLLVVAAAGAGQLLLLARRRQHQQLARAIAERNAELIRRNEELSQLDFVVQGINRDSGGRFGLDEPARRLLRLLPPGSALAVLEGERGGDRLVPLCRAGYAEPHAARFAQPLDRKALALDRAVPVARGLDRLPGGATTTMAVSLLLRGDAGQPCERLLLLEHPSDAQAFDAVELERLRRCREYLLLAIDRVQAPTEPALQARRDAADHRSVGGAGR
jgi:hypothetical protein